MLAEEFVVNRTPGGTSSVMRKIEADTIRIPESAKWGKRGTLPARLTPEFGKMKRIRILFIPRGRPSRELNSRRDRNPIRSPWLSASPLPTSSSRSPNSVGNFARSQRDRFLPCVFTSKLSSSWRWWVQSLSFFFFSSNWKTLPWILELWRIRTRRCSPARTFVCTFRWQRAAGREIYRADLQSYAK